MHILTWYIEHHPSILLYRLNWGNLSTRRKKLQATLMFKIIKGLSPAYLQDLFSIRSTTYNLKDSEIKLNLPKPHTNNCKRALGYSGALLWNSLPVTYENQTLLGILKGNLINFTAIVSRAPTRQSCNTMLFYSQGR